MIQVAIKMCQDAVFKFMVKHYWLARNVQLPNDGIERCLKLLLRLVKKNGDWVTDHHPNMQPAHLLTSMME